MTAKLKIFHYFTWGRTFDVNVEQIAISAKNAFDFLVSDIKFEISGEQGSGSQGVVFRGNVFQIIWKFILFAIPIEAVIIIAMMVVTASAATPTAT